MKTWLRMVRTVWNRGERGVAIYLVVTFALSIPLFAFFGWIDSCGRE